MAQVIPGRQAPTLPESGCVTFLIGMRINRLWQVWRWLPVFLAMPRMLIELQRTPDLGLVGRPRTFTSGRVILVWQQWTSFEQLEAYARNAGAAHLPAWKAFNKRTRGNTSVGIYHETYLVKPGTMEGIYVNMPLFGLGGAVGVADAATGRTTAAQRLGR
jgi:hypothetical protein